MTRSARRPVIGEWALAALLVGATVAGTADSPAAAALRSTTAAPAIAPVFDCAFENYAWSRVVSGRVVDRDGTIFSYSRRGGPLSGGSRTEDGRSFIADADLIPRFASRTRVGAVALKDLETQMARLAEAAAGTVTREDTGARDAGSHVCVGYIHDDARHRSQVVTLGSYGSVNDTRLRNSAPAAQALLDWLTRSGVSK